MIRIGERFYIDILVNGESLPFTKVGFEKVQLHSSWLFYCPMGQLTLVDSQQHFNKSPINDGTKITILIGTANDTTKANMYKFRVYNINKKTLAGTITKYVINLIYDCPRYINESTTNVYKDTSAETLRKIASEVPFANTDIDVSADSMAWLPFGKKRAPFVRSITDYAYLDSQSCFRVGVTLNGTFKFKNTSLIDSGKTKNIFMRAAKIGKTAIKVLNDKEVSSAGIQNQYSGYKMATTEQGTATDKTHTKVVAPTPATSVNINKNIATGVEAGTMKTAPIKSSNTHDNYAVANHQNTRIKNTFSFHTYVVIDVGTKLDLFDPVIYIKIEQAEGTQTVNQKVSGSYLIAAKTVYLTKEGHYFEKFQLSRQGYNASVVTKDLLQSVNSE